MMEPSKVPLHEIFDTTALMTGLTTLMEILPVCVFVQLASVTLTKAYARVALEEVLMATVAVLEPALVETVYEVPFSVYVKE